MILVLGDGYQVWPIIYSIIPETFPMPPDPFGHALAYLAIHVRERAYGIQFVLYDGQTEWTGALERSIGMPTDAVIIGTPRD